MIGPILAVSTALVIWALLAGWFERRRVTAPMVVVGAGLVVGFLARDEVGAALNAAAALQVAEIILAILLFIDASETRGRLLGSRPGAALRVLLVATPLSIAAAMLLGSWLFPAASWALLLVLACVVVPTDFSPATSILRNRRVPARVRDVLNVEAGYKDGLLTPVLFFGITVAAGTAPSGNALHALAAAGWAVGVAIVVGTVLGWLLGAGVNAAERRGWMTAQSERVVVVAAPLLTFAAALGLEANQFVAPFLCGVVFHHLRRRSARFDDGHRLIDDIGFLLTAQMWFVFGVVAVLVLAEDLRWRSILFCAAVLTVVRMVPVALALLGAGFTRAEVALVGWLGPRGTSSIVFALLAYNLLPVEQGDHVLAIMVMTVLGSIVLHGAGSPLAAHLIARRRARRRAAG